jgi:hypothetical protein
VPKMSVTGVQRGVIFTKTPLRGMAGEGLEDYVNVIHPGVRS